MDMAGIQAAAQRLQQAYRQAGYGAVVVLVPAQDLAGGSVRLEVIEGKLQQVQVTGQRAFSTANVLASLPALQIGQTPRLFDLDGELLMANENPAKSVRVVLQPGESRGDVEALVVVEEQDPKRLQFVLDNTGNSDTGRYRLSALYQHANVDDRDIVFGLRAATSPTEPSRVAVLGSTLRVPLYANKIFIEGSLLASNTQSATNTTPAGDLRFSGNGLAVGARLIRTLASPSETKAQLAVGIDARRYRNDCSLGEFGAAGCGSAAASVDVLPVTLSYSWQKPGQFAASASWVSNLALGSAGRDADFEASRPGATSRYHLLRWNVYGQQRLTADWIAAWRTDGQWAAKPLVFAEQYGAGGANSVRGFEERSFNSDSGASVSLELRRTLQGTAVPVWLGETTVSGFIDAAGVHNRSGTDCAPGQTRCSLWGAGVGLSARTTPKTQWRLDVARAGSDVNSTRRGDWRLHLSLSHTL